MSRAVAISLKIPDNTAYTAAVALRRLAINVERVERSEIWFFDDGGDVPALIACIAADETIFNPNKHRVTVLDEPVPRSGEVWIEPLDPVTLSLSKGDREKAAPPGAYSRRVASRSITRRCTPQRSGSCAIRRSNVPSIEATRRNGTFDARASNLRARI